MPVLPLSCVQEMYNFRTLFVNNIQTTYCLKCSGISLPSFYGYEEVLSGNEKKEKESPSKSK